MNSFQKLFVTSYLVVLALLFFSIQSVRVDLQNAAYFIILSILAFIVFMIFALSYYDKTIREILDDVTEQIGENRKAIRDINRVVELHLGDHLCEMGKKITKGNPKKNLSIIRSYSISIEPLPEEEGGGYMAVYPAIGRSIVGYGETPMEALKDLEASVPVLLESLEEHGEELPLQKETKND